MIKADRENSVTIQGSGLTVLGEFALLTKALIDTLSEKAPHDMVVSLVNGAFETGRELAN
jgi:hypothetical protein